MFKNMCNLTELIQLLGTRAVVFTETSVRLENALKNCKEHKKYFQSVEIHGKNLSLLTTEMLWLRKTELKVFLILTSLETASIILEIALRHNIFNSDFIWILPHPTISVTTLMKLPDVVFLIDINGSYQSISCPNYVWVQALFVFFLSKIAKCFTHNFLNLTPNHNHFSQWRSWI